MVGSSPDKEKREERTFWRQLIDLKPGLDKEGTITNILENKEMQGANAWLLMCSIMIASIGLDINSPAVIIGAMLISPLMSPILGIGLSMGINDRRAFFVSLRHFFVSIGIALGVSTLYFLITPLGESTHEILSRTEPTTLDAMIALFGGIAGIISGSRKDKSNAIPGVAIATALMPPLCVCGFGISKLIKLGFSATLSSEAPQLGFFVLNSFYLFFLNSFFVALATWAIVKYLRFPVHRFVDAKTRRKTTRLMMLCAFVVTLPSILILGRVFQKSQDQKIVQTFLSQYADGTSKYIDDTRLIDDIDGRKLIIKVYGKGFTREMNYYERGLAKLGLEDTKVEIIRTSEIDLESFKALENRVSHMNTTVSERLNIAQQNDLSKEIKITQLQEILDSMDDQISRINRVCAGVPIMVERITSVSYVPSPPRQDSIHPVFFYQWSGADPTERLADEQKLRAYIETLLNLSDFRLTGYTEYPN